MKKVLVLLALVVGAAAQDKPAAAAAPHVSAFAVWRELTQSEKSQLLDVIGRFGAERLDSPMFDDHGLVLLKSADPGSALKISAALAETALAKAGLQPVPVEQNGQHLVVRSGRFLVYFPKDLDRAEARRRLSELKFEILEQPTRLLPAYCVRRSQDPKDFAADLAALQKIPGVRAAVADSLTVTLR